MSERRHSLSPLVGVVLVVTAVAGCWAIGKWKTARNKPAVEPVLLTGNRGEILYIASCAACHGSDGRGDGEAAAALKPPPRDFAARPWRFEPTKEAIARVIRDGIPGTPMVSARETLTAGDIVLLADYVHYLAHSRPTVPYEPTAAERLLSEAGFVPRHGSPVPPLTLKNSAGKSLKLGSLRGKLVILHFWGTGCEHCLREMAALKKLEVDWSARGLRVLHICTDADSAREAQSLLDQVSPGLMAWTEPSGIGLVRLDVKLLPTVWIVDAEGRAVGRGQGARDWSSPAVRKVLEQLLPK